METEPRTLVIRADGGAKIGIGHVMRGLALGQAWRKAGGRVHFITTNPSDPLIARLEGEGFSVHLLPEGYPAKADWRGTAKVLHAVGDAWLMLDGYHFDSAYHRLAREAGASTLAVDDNAHLDRYDTHLILNPNAHAGGLSYVSPPETRRLLGLDYVLLRQEFEPDNRVTRETPETARRVLFTFGGTDPLHLAERSIEALDHIAMPGLEALILTSGEGPDHRALEASLSESGHAIRLEENVADVTPWMAWADLAVSSGGTTVWELAFMGVPALVIASSPAERLMMGGLEEIGLFQPWPLGQGATPKALASRLESLLRDVEWRRKMTARGQRLVDGRGRDRVVAEMVRPQAR